MYCIVLASSHEFHFISNTCQKFVSLPYWDKNIKIRTFWARFTQSATPDSNRSFRQGI